MTFEHHKGYRQLQCSFESLCDFLLVFCSVFVKISEVLTHSCISPRLRVPVGILCLEIGNWDGGTTV